MNAVEKLSGDLCISRPKSRLSWGIELPFDPEYVNFVWFDALTNYISFIGYDPAKKNFADQPEGFREKWPALHILGKDILSPAHGIYWPIMLHALGFPDEQMPRFLVHGWWNRSGSKMSKSLGNVVDPCALADKYGPDAIRYYLMADITSGKDADFSEERLVSRYNSELANSLGNLLNRTLNMTWKFADGKLARAGAESIDIREEYVTAMAAWFIHQGLSQAFQLAAFCNERIDSQKPWVLARDAAQRAALDALLYNLAESLRIIAILISPVLPQAAHGIFDQLNWRLDLRGQEERFSLGEVEWGKLPDGHVVGEPVPLFPRTETKAAPAA